MNVRTELPAECWYYGIQETTMSRIIDVLFNQDVIVKSLDPLIPYYRINTLESIHSVRDHNEVAYEKEDEP